MKPDRVGLTLKPDRIVLTKWHPLVYTGVRRTATGVRKTVTVFRNGKAVLLQEGDKAKEGDEYVYTKKVRGK